MPEEAPKILIASKSQPIEEIKATAAATKVDPNKLVEEKLAEKPKEEPSSQASRVGGIVEAGLVAGGLEAVQESARAFGEKVGEKAKTTQRSQPEPGEARETPSSLTFEQIDKNSKDPDLNEDERKYWIEKRKQILDDVINLDDGEFLEGVRSRALSVLEESDWDNVYSNLVDLAKSKDLELAQIMSQAKGLMRQAIMAEAARVVSGGIEKREKVEPGSVTDGWLKNHHYTRERVERLRHLAQEKKLFDLLPDAPEELVGTKIPEYPDYDALKADTDSRMQDTIRRLEQEWSERLRQATQAQPAQPFSPEDFARAMGVANPEQQKELYLKAEESMVPMQMELQVPSFLLSLDLKTREREQREWQARARLATAAANKRMAPSFDKLFPNQEAIDITKENLQSLLEKKGVMEALSFYTTIIAKDRDPGLLLDQNAHLSESVKESIFDIKNGDQLRVVRETMRGWLEKNLGLDRRQDGRDAEQIAWNIIFLSNLVEEFDSSFRHPQNPGRIPPVIGQLKSLPTWMMMHPQERLRTKVGDPKKWKATPPDPPETWSVFGEWAVNKSRATGRPLDQIVLPTIMFENILKGIKAKTTTNGSEQSLFEIFFKNGETLLSNPSAEIIRGDDIKWDEVGEGPFGGYYFDKMSPAIKVFGVIATGEWKGRLTELGDACRKLGLTRKEREALLMAINGVDPQSGVLKAKGYNPVTWSWYLGAVKEYAPNFFR